jgi:hypothetical protein
VLGSPRCPCHESQPFNGWYPPIVWADSSQTEGDSLRRVGKQGRLPEPSAGRQRTAHTYCPPASRRITPRISSDVSNATGTRSGDLVRMTGLGEQIEQRPIVVAEGKWTRRPRRRTSYTEV